MIVNLIDRIIIYDSKHIEVKFRYQDRFETAIQYIESFESSNMKGEGQWADAEKLNTLV